MSSSVLPAQAATRLSGATVSQVSRIPWYIWSCLTASVCIMTGLYWDISWHETIGRDSFWTPAHLLIQFAAVLTAVSCSYLIFGTTFARNPAARQSSVNVLGFRGPLGAFICAWGGATMLTSAPFDNWWHDAYGLDVKIISPPHAMLALGIAGIMWGGVILILGQMNRVEGAQHRHLQWMLLLSGGFMVILDMVFKLEYTNRILMHSAIMYLAVSIWLPVLLESIARASGWRWARTAMTGVYTLFFLLALWIFPLFPGEPKLGPVYQHVTHFIPLHFPILLIAPAFALDLLWPRIAAKNWNKWLQAAIVGSAFVIVFVVVQWPFGTFLNSPGSRNAFFGTQYFYYAEPSSAPEIRNVFVQFETGTRFAVNLALAFVAAILSTRLGITLGDWMRRVRR
ncbi:MAG TPA: hypothetical protein VN176_16650 [Verrucomicrobiae bacterium]|nr:hypothetical protein [Verrucomicrobiae bacterium]